MMYATSWSPKLPPICTAHICLFNRRVNGRIPPLNLRAPLLAGVYENLAVVTGAEPDVTVLCVYAHDAATVADVVRHIVVAEVSAYLHCPYLPVEPRRVFGEEFDRR